MTTNRKPPNEVVESRKKIKEFFEMTGPDGQLIGAATCGVYAFFDYDGEPIYVGQTVETLRDRVGRHLTGRRSDPVGKYVLDPFEVLEIEAWPLWGVPKPERKELADRLEYAVFQRCLAESRFGAVLNEGSIKPAEAIELPESYRARIVPEELLPDRTHPDIRLARRAATIANLARHISERKVSVGLRATLLVQAQRLEHLARERYSDFDS